MKILFVSAVLPYPLYSGGQIRIYNLLKRLVEKHEIHLYSFIRSDKEKEYLPKLSFCKKVVTVYRGHAWQPKYVLKTLTNPYPFLWNTYYNSEMLSLLSDEIAKGEYDLVHIEPGYVWPSIPTQHRVPIVIAEHNIEHEVYGAYAKQFSVQLLRPFMSLDVAKMAKWEQRSWQESAGIVAVSEDDKKYISQYSGGKPVTVVPNGVDIDTFDYKPKKHTNVLTFLYVGNFKWMENKDAADNITQNYWPVIKEKHPLAVLRIVGQHAPDGPVTDIVSEFHKADVLLAPIRVGGGTKFKILESMAAGLPVITTTVGAQGLPRENLWIADAPSQLDIDAVLEDKLKIKKARKLIESEYNWDIIAGKLDAVWNSLS